MGGSLKGEAWQAKKELGFPNKGSFRREALAKEDSAFVPCN
jgi:hypothetical protein